MKKTVYVLGAGFSMDAKAPSQENLVKNIFKLYAENIHVFKKGSVEKFRLFLKETMLIPDELHEKVPLEDLFTPLDRCLLDNISYRNLGNKEIVEIRKLIYYLIGTTLQHVLQAADKEYIDVFAKYLVEVSSKRKNYNYKKVDLISVISTNWDILLDNSIKNYINHNFLNQAVVDYCCHISSYEKNDETILPGLEMLGKGGFNVKLIKLHGSLNWLQCPNCHRLYVKFDEKIGMQSFNTPSNCRHCDTNFEPSEAHQLVSNSIMPTFIKDFSNPQYKVIWQNAAIEISEASKIVFIGYSLPYADFEMRQMLSRMVRRNAKIEVVSYGKSSRDQQVKELIKRYQVFFGNRFNGKVFSKGAKAYVEKKFKK
ncbi:hypothetical protein IM792_09230 [Mucilaginibacter sp. JRF]|uniref:hypothetical protein n=1 Tax=Mucilaginibacter sp. JRF TaxID=2780088 RepID=UPI00187EC9EB|nr:hypothetical protein [Mucilaginibacter sp. JRF]MBE9584626.1 hypothetical protein [Mucilaginibacter sp. JRF]